MGWRLTRDRRGMPNLPCGCYPTTTRQPAQVLVNRDGTRLCQHGKMWKFAWIEVKRGKQKGAQPDVDAH
jgi:hypothetical protein